METQRKHSFVSKAAAGKWTNIQGLSRCKAGAGCTQVNILLSCSEHHRGRPVTWQGLLRATIKGEHKYFLQKISWWSWYLSRDEYGLKTEKLLWRIISGHNYPTIPFNQTPGWLLISSNSLSFLAHSSEVQIDSEDSCWTFQPLSVIITSHIYKSSGNIDLRPCCIYISTGRKKRPKGFFLKSEKAASTKSSDQSQGWGQYKKPIS